MDSANLFSFFQNSTEILIEKHITVQGAAKLTGYNPQYLRRLLRADFDRIWQSVRAYACLAEPDGVYILARPQPWL